MAAEMGSSGAGTCVWRTPFRMGQTPTCTGLWNPAPMHRQRNSPIPCAGGWEGREGQRTNTLPCDKEGHNQSSRCQLGLSFQMDLRAWKKSFSFGSVPAWSYQPAIHGDKFWRIKDEHGVFPPLLEGLFSTARGLWGDSARGQGLLSAAALC